MLLTKLRSVWNPDQFQGWGRKNRYFEGWYFKLVSADEQHAMAFIPGISMGENGDHHAFIQVMDGKACTAEYHRFDSADFRPSTRGFEVFLGNNYFSSEKIILDLPGISGEIQFKNSTPWPKMIGAPGIMGWYSFVPFMECNHGIVSLHHELEGNLQITNKPITFTGGKGYIEKDWGRSFPRAYVWMQCNHFDTSDRASMMASAAHIPWLGSHFIGFISGMWLEGRLFKFATYTGAKKFLKIEGENVELIFKNPKTELRIRARQATGTSLRSPLSGEMKGKIQESLQATVQVELLENGHRIFEGIGRNAALEVAGIVEVLQD
ncbi:MAG: tocopherol cyclase family protein [Saprospiraceae bacterium]|nr:tocopherol cyclase family protein [Saprospiraceae bacterium]